jgi:hypothetical protein
MFRTPVGFAVDAAGRGAGFVARPRADAGAAFPFAGARFPAAFMAGAVFFAACCFAAFAPAALFPVVFCFLAAMS